MNIRQALTSGAAMLHDYGIRDSHWNAERLLQLALSFERAQLFAELSTELAPEQENLYRSLLSRRALHYPLAYLEGVQEFFGREFGVNETVLIPRPETEEIIRAVHSLTLSRPVILDIGAGSGAIAVTFSYDIQGARIIALEKSIFAMPVLKQNSQGRIDIIRGDLYHLPFRNSVFDVVVSNPPYVELSEYEQLPRETRWEPREALITSNLEQTYETLLLSSERILKSAGFLIFEIGYGQSERIKALVRRVQSFNLIEIRADHQEIPRTFVLQKIA
ncbi:MAG TPA: HemK/PrmC family methyltransferase [Acidobacteriota bacterium]